MTRTAATLVLALLVAGPAAAQRMSYGKAPTPGDKPPDMPAHAGIDQKLGAKAPLDQTYYDHRGRPTTLAAVADGKPLVLVLAYYRCPKLCNEVLRGLLLAMKDLRQADPTFVAGGTFNVAVVSIDPREAPATVGPKQQFYFDEYDKRDADAAGWKFLTASHGQGTDVPAAERQIHELANAVGYRYSLRYRNADYTYSPDGGWADEKGKPLPEHPRDYDYGHASGIAVLTPDGTVSRYLLGINYSARDLRLSVVDAGGGKVGSFFDRNVAQFCFVYDEVGGHYKLTMRWLAAAAVPAMLAVLYLAYRTIRTARREVPVTLGDPAPSPQ